MVTMVQRIEALREEKGLSRPTLAAALGLPKGAIEKFETGRQTPTREQQQRMAEFFGVSLFYLRGESGDRTRMESWLEGAPTPGEADHIPAPAPKKAPKAPAAGGDGTLFEAFRSSRGFQDMVRATVLEVLRSPEGQDLLSQVLRRELTR